MTYRQRRRIKTEEKAKVVADEFVKFLAARAVLHQDYFEENDEFIFFFKSSWCNSSYSSKRPRAKQLARQEFNKFCPLSSSDDLCLFFCTYLSSIPLGLAESTHCENYYTKTPLLTVYVWLPRDPDAGPALHDWPHWGQLHGPRAGPHWHLLSQVSVYRLCTLCVSVSLWSKYTSSQRKRQMKSSSLPPMTVDWHFNEWS